MGSLIIRGEVTQKHSIFQSTIYWNDHLQPSSAHRPGSRLREAPFWDRWEMLGNETSQLLVKQHTTSPKRSFKVIVFPFSYIYVYIPGRSNVA